MDVNSAMLGVSAKKFGILKNFLDLAQSSMDVLPLVQGNAKFFLDSLYDGDPAISELAVSLLAALAATPRYRPCLCAAGVPASLEELLPELRSPAVRDAAAVAIQQLRGGGGGGGSSGSAAAAAATPAAAPRKEVRGVQLNMDGLLGRKDQEDQYIKALLLIDGITSVTIDRTRSVAIAYTYEEREMKGQLYDVVQGVCDRQRDAAGLRRIAVRKMDHATYLEDDDSEDEDEGEDFFADKKLVVHAAGKPAAQRSADERLRDAARGQSSAPATGIIGGALGWLGSASSGWW